MIKIKKYNESYVKVFCDDNVSMDLAHVFSMYANGYMYDGRYKAGLWDGRIYHFDHTNNLLSLGLTFKCANYIHNTLKKNVYIDNDIYIKADKFSDEYIRKFVKEKLKQTIMVPRDYQCLAIREMVYHRRLTIESATGSGKSFIIWVALCLIMHHYKSLMNKILIMVPNVQLVNQLVANFNEYSNGTFSEFICNYRKKNHDLTKLVHIANSQAIFRKPAKYFDMFDCLIVDECHNVRGGEMKTYSKCIIKCENAIYKLGLCGYIPDDKSLRLNCEALFGPIKTITKAHTLIKSGKLSNFKVQVIILKYTSSRISEYRSGIPLTSGSGVQKYQHENTFLNKHADRRVFICKLASTRKSNTLILVKSRKNHGDLLYNELKGSDKTVFYVHGNVDENIRENIRTYTNDHDNVIIVATLKTFSEGIDIKNLHHIILAESIKAEIAIIQSIGRILRVHESKDIAILYDLSDDLRSKSKYYNYSLKHLTERINLYKNNKLKYEISYYRLK